MKENIKIYPLGDVCNIQRGLTYSGKDTVDESNIVVLRATNIDLASGRLIFDELKFLRADFDINSKYLLSKGSLLICFSSGSKSHLGKVALVDKDYPNYYYGGFIGQIVPSSKIDSKFLYYLLISTNYKEYILQLTDGININNLKINDLKSFQIPLPPLPEQHRIVSILDHCFAAIDKAKANAEQNLLNAKELFESYLDSVDADKTPLGRLVEIKTGRLNANQAVENGEYPFFTCSREVFAIDHYAFNTEAILLAGNNASGDFNVKHYSGKFNAYQRTYVITIKSTSEISYRYLYFQLLKSLKEFKKMSIGANTRFLKIGMIRELLITLPSIEKQHKVVETLNMLMEQSQNLQSHYQKRIDDLEELKKSILQKAFVGELKTERMVEEFA